jgi:hypothetical protein
MECDPPSPEEPSWRWIASSRLRPSDDPFFDEGNEACNLCHKQFKTASDSDDENRYNGKKIIHYNFLSDFTDPLFLRVRLDTVMEGFLTSEGN